ncbi:MAG TPA: F0F1 ATP synthase subunit B [Candidatus Saccharimonadales bacterium]|nr:F0F1 ATP synthase subunit B [Candidatus Saccharimonadales bacterium]
MISLIIEFAADSANSGILGLDVHEFVVQLITFILAILALMKFAVSPINKMLDARRETIEKGVSLGEKMQKDQAEMEAKVAAALRDAREQADKIIADAAEHGRQAIVEAEAKAKEKAEAIIASGQERVEQDIKEARTKLEKELSGLVAEATEAVIGEKVDAKKDAALIDKALRGRA